MSSSSLPEAADDEIGRRTAESVEVIELLLERARLHLGMDVAFVSAVDRDVQRFTYLTGAGSSFGWDPDFEIPASDGYCQYVLSGELPNIVRDSNANLLASTLASTHQSRIGAYLGVPLILSSGRVYGALCLASHAPTDRFGNNDVQFLAFLGRLIADELSGLEQATVWRSLKHADLAHYLETTGMTTCGQPIRVLATNAVCGVEALTSFPGVPGGPLQVFTAAEEVGLLERLEVGAVVAALEYTAMLPDGVFLSVNASPGVAVGDGLAAAIDDDLAPRVVIELTEHATFGDQQRLRDTMAAQRERGIRFAIDDVGAGYSSLSVVLALRPEFLKLDIDLVRDIDSDPGRQSLVRSITTFAADTGAQVIAEGIETDAERLALIDGGVLLGQGYLLGRPAPFADLDLR